MTDASAPPPGPSRRFRLTLYASLALNLLFVGVIGGAALHGPPDRPGMMGRDLGFGPFTEALSPADRKALFESFRAAGGNPREMRNQMKADLASFIAVLRTEPLDSAQLSAALAGLREKGAQRIELGQRLMTERILQMTPDDRKAFADRLEAALARGPRKGAADRPAE